MARAEVVVEDKEIPGCGLAWAKKQQSKRTRMEDKFP